MLEKIIEIAKSCCEADISWSKDTSILTDMELSSLEIFDFISKVEKQFSIHIKERDLSEIDTLEDLEKVVEKEMRNQ